MFNCLGKDTHKGDDSDNWIFAYFHRTQFRGNERILSIREDHRCFVLLSLIHCCRGTFSHDHGKQCREVFPAVEAANAIYRSREYSQ